MTIKPPRTLAIRDAIRLYFIVGKHIDTKDTQKTVFEFIKNLVEKLTAEEYVECVCILTGTIPEEITKEDAPLALKAFIDGIAMNKIVKLVSWMDLLK